MHRLYPIVVLVGCHATAVGVAGPDDGGGDAEIDANDSAPPADAFVLLDGRVCSGPDKDRDGKNDECDECPTVRDLTTLGTASIANVGKYCASVPPFEDAVRRAAFFGFDTAPDLIQFSSPAWETIEVPNNHVLQTPSGTDDDRLRFVLFRTVVEPTVVVATSQMAFLSTGVDARTGGILLRATSGATDFYLCWVGDRLFGLSRAPTGGCDGDVCALVPLKNADGMDAVGAIPPGAKLPDDAMNADASKRYRALRASVKSDATMDLVECRVFSPGGAYLQAESPNFIVQAQIPAAERSNGTKVGLASRRAQIQFIDFDLHQK